MRARMFVRAERASVCEATRGHAICREKALCAATTEHTRRLTKLACDEETVHSTTKRTRPLHSIQRRLTSDEPTPKRERERERRLTTTHQVEKPEIAALVVAGRGVPHGHAHQVVCAFAAGAAAFCCCC
jgi:hypothetical protein